MKVFVGASRVGLLAAASAVILAGCGSGSSDTSGGTAKYDQSWSKPYSSTTCADFKTSMSQQQKFAMAADMLVGARKAHGISSMPSDEMVNTFVGGLATACVDDSMTMTDMGAGLYITDHDRWQ